jgi:hypothetical protein
MVLALHVFMQDLLSQNVGGSVGCPEVALVVDNAAIHQMNFRPIGVGASVCSLIQNSEFPSQRSYRGWTQISVIDNSKQICLALSDRSKRISRWGEPRPTGAISSRFNSGTPVTNNQELPPVAPPRMISPEISGNRKNGLHNAIDISPSKEAPLRKIKEQCYTIRYNVHKLRHDGPGQNDLTSAVERALQICDTRPRFLSSS